MATGTYFGVVKVWRVDTGALLRTIVGHAVAVRSLVFSPTGSSLFTASDDKQVKQFSFEYGSEIRTFAGHVSAVLAVAASSDGQRIASGSYSGRLLIQNVADGEVLNKIETESCINSISYSRDGSRLATGSNNYKCKIYDDKNLDIVGEI